MVSPHGLITDGLGLGRRICDRWNRDLRESLFLMSEHYEGFNNEGFMLGFVIGSIAPGMVLGALSGLAIRNATQAQGSGQSIGHPGTTFRASAAILRRHVLGTACPPGEGRPAPASNASTGRSAVPARSGSPARRAEADERRRGQLYSHQLRPESGMFCDTPTLRRRFTGSSRRRSAIRSE